MKKGLKLDTAFHVLGVLKGWKYCPDEEGIET